MQRPIKLMFLVLLAASRAGAQSDSESVWSGVYSKAQATRGQVSYGAECSGCHQPDLTGVGGVLAGDRFREHWSEDRLESFFHRVKTTMPPRAKGGLPDATYLEIVSYILQSNGYPSGENDLTLAGVSAVRIEAKDGPHEVPEFALVRSVGCLNHDADGEWVLDHASAAARTRDPNSPTTANLADDAKLSGTITFHFLNLMPYDVATLNLQEQKGHKVEAKGLLIRKADRRILNLTSVSSVSSACP